ncbi:MAG: NAD(P)-binding domain-containing protein [Saprospiraceae bacterium]|nr:NAD(P)-binding domain-containing protein [Saprospiraceae bacterium]MCB9317685.1 NAD(P)-binding domain-containing protein [Lewinellaceae bacterium]
MKIGILGTGIVGQTLAEKVAEVGHEVMSGTRNVDTLLAKSNPDSYGRPPFKDWLHAHPGIQVGTLDETAAFGTLLINAMYGMGSIQALQTIGPDHLSGKILLDIANPLDFSRGFPPSLSICNTDSLGEEIQRTFPQLKVVKSLNTMNTNLMVHPRALSGDQTVFISGNDADAKETVKVILKSFGWKESEMIDLGDISTARGTEQLLPIWVRIYSKMGHANFNFKIVTG